MSHLTLNSNIHNYDVYFEENYKFINDLINIEKKAFIIDKNVYELYKELFLEIKEEELYLLNAIEKNKCIKEIEKMYKFLAKFDAKRNITLISIGGGITQDLTGFVASTLYRGIKWIFIPTTFLAQADSCIGSKISLNFESYKNLLGGFYPPNKIFIQPDFLNTLTTKDYFSGIGEVIKFSLLEENYPKNFENIISMVNSLKVAKDRLQTIKKTMQIKKCYIDEDEFDTGKRNLFNYGHCFGHALENSSKYKVPHGIAVTIGMIFANIVSLNRNLISQKLFDFLNETLFIPNIPIKLKINYFGEEILLKSMKNDKKRVNANLTIIIPIDEDIRAEKIDDLTEDEFIEAYKYLLKVLKI